jgi:hypothetical protein
MPICSFHQITMFISPKNNKEKTKYNYRFIKLKILNAKWLEMGFLWLWLPYVSSSLIKYD